ncbi:hypothetical protein FRC10_010128 [Ceratobasidium sp. 414]|nr:hypothetical protein FRC10_010128 [Ceratobasidium sp. 414]
MALQHLDALLAYTGLVALATTSVYLGSLGSHKPRRQKEGDADSDDEDDLGERLSASDAIWFPVIGSVVLGGFYLAFKYLGDEWINKLMGYYFLVAGVASVWNCLASLAKYLFPRAYKSTPLIPLPLVGIKLRLPTLVLLLPSALPSLYYFVTKSKSALLTDILALSVAHSALSTLKLDSLQTGCVLLGGLFFYDVWWVFGTSVMTTVATSLDIPVKLLFPRSILSLLSLVPAPEKNQNMLLGLGDVVIPGTLVALAHRLDMHLRRKKQQGNEKDNVKGKRKAGSSYLRATLIGYFVGLSMAFAAMHMFSAAQPALLYLSPSCCLAFIFNAVKRDELGYVWNWEDGADEKKEKEKADKEKKDKEGKES